MSNRSEAPEASVDLFLLFSALVVLALVALAPEVALAQSSDMPGQQLLQFARSYIIAPIALFAIVITGVAALIRPDMIRTSGYIAIIAVVLYFLLANADRVLQVMRAG